MAGAYFKLLCRFDYFIDKFVWTTVSILSKIAGKTDYNVDEAWESFTYI